MVISPSPAAVVNNGPGSEANDSLSGSSATIVFDSTENEFEPESPVIATNGTVIFTNNSNRDITIISTDSQTYQPLNVTVPAGSSQTVSFNTNGAYHYGSSNIPAIKGTITVED